MKSFIYPLVIEAHLTRKKTYKKEKRSSQKTTSYFTQGDNFVASPVLLLPISPYLQLVGS